MKVMTTQQPIWKYIANLGDVNPAEHGGLFIYTDETGIYPPEAELLEPSDPEGDSQTTWTVRRFILENLEFITVNGKDLLVPAGFPDRTDLPYPIESYDEWFNDGLESVASFIGISVGELRYQFASSDPCVRANAWRRNRRVSRIR